MRIEVGQIEVLQAHGKTGQCSGVRHALGDAQRLQCRFGQLIQLGRVRKQVLAQGLVHQLFDEILLTRGSCRIRPIAQRVSGTSVLRGLKSVEMLQALGQLKAGIWVVDVLRHAQVNTSDGVDHLDQSREVHDDEVLDIKTGEAVHRVQRAAGRRSEIAAGAVGSGEYRIEHHVVLGGNSAVRSDALRHVHQRVARNGDEIDRRTVCGDLHHHGRVGLMIAFGVFTATDGQVLLSVS